MRQCILSPSFNSLKNGKSRAQRWSLIEADYQLANIFEKESLSKMKDIFDKLIKLHYELALKCQQKARLAEDLLTPIITAIRNELDFTFDCEAYVVMKKESDKKWGENLEKYNDSMKNMYEEMFNKYTHENHNNQSVK